MKEITDFIILISDLKVGDIVIWEDEVGYAFRLITSVDQTVHPTKGYPLYNYNDVLVEFDTDHNLVLFVDCVGRGTGIDHFISIVPPIVMQTIGDIFQIEACELPEWFVNEELPEDE